jgi:hypothetical protein
MVEDLCSPVLFFQNFVSRFPEKEVRPGNTSRLNVINLELMSIFTREQPSNGAGHCMP